MNFQQKVQQFKKVPISKWPKLHKMTSNCKCLWLMENRSQYFLPVMNRTENSIVGLVLMSAQWHFHEPLPLLSGTKVLIVTIASSAHFSLPLFKHNLLTVIHSVCKILMKKGTVWSSPFWEYLTRVISIRKLSKYVWGLNTKTLMMLFTATDHDMDSKRPLNAHVRSQDKCILTIVSWTKAALCNCHGNRRWALSHPAPTRQCQKPDSKCSLRSSHALEHE